MHLVNLGLRLALGRRLPHTSGTISLPGLKTPVTIRRDRFGVACIDAEEEDGAWFGLGFCQAQDRAFQLELRLRTFRGTLSQLFGEQTLAIDRLSRRIGFVDSARRQLPVLDGDVRAQVDAFVHGINAGLTAGSGAVAHEFALLRAKPSLWQPEDVLAMGKLLSFLLIGNWDVELARLKILLTDGPAALRDLDPTPYPADQFVVSPPSQKAGKTVDYLAQDLERFLAFAGHGGGSNAWAVSGSKTRSGRPILANDPHLDGTLPPHWYLAHLRTPAWSVAGASMIGAPGIAAGHNGFAAWGVTAGLADTTDLFIEEVGPDGRSIRRGDGFEACELRREVIEVKGHSPVVEDVLVTPRGPIITPALTGDLPALSLRAVWLDARPARGFLRLHEARSFDDFRACFAQWPLLSQNVVYADEDGHIGWQLAGEVPVRGSGNGTLPLPARDPAAGWEPEPVPFAAMPFVKDPAAGFVVTANNQPVPDDTDAPFLGADWLDGYRAGRISESLADRNDWDIASTHALQMDVVSLTWREVRDIILSLDQEEETADAPNKLGRLTGFSPSPRAGSEPGSNVSPSLPTGRGLGGGVALALDLLHTWDGSVSADSAATTVFERFLREMARRIARARAPHSAEWALGRGFNDLVSSTTFAAGRQSRVLRRLREQPPGWFAQGWQQEMRSALSAVVRDLQVERGPEPSSWRWGDVRPQMLEHPMGAVKLLQPLFNRGPFPWGGDGNTVSQASGSHPGVIASLRAVIPLGDWEWAHFVLPGGQSGNPFSPHYDDQLPLWQQGKGIPIAWSPDAVAAATIDTLRLLPMHCTTGARLGIAVGLRRSLRCP